MAHAHKPSNYFLKKEIKKAAQDKFYPAPPDNPYPPTGWRWMEIHASPPRSLLKKSLFEKDNLQKWDGLFINSPLLMLSSHKKAVFAPGVGDLRTAIS